MELHTIKPPDRSRKKRRRVGRGAGSQRGKTSGRGHKGQLSRSGAKRKRGFEGGQMPLHRRLPKFGFTNIFRTEFQIVNVSDLARCEPGEITGDTLVKAGLIKHTRQPIKILGNGNIEKAYVVKAAAFSKAAVVKLEAAGGKAEVVK
ncbi:MAG: 50S ribosomal protein L15 [Candidatus Zixiibacteriota bacterium]|nr:MAG: 50S ribosomal protein L15 [candidate division Zixibacteria bacterium]